MLIDLRTEGLNLYFLCPFIGCFCLIGSSFVSSNSIFGDYPFLKNILISISEILVIIPYFIYKIFKKCSNKKRTINKSSDDKLIFEKIEKEKNGVKIWKYILLGLIDFLNTFILYLGKDLFWKKKFKFYFMSSNILFLNVFQKFILNAKIYRYQIASLIIFFLLDAAYIISLIFDKILSYNFIEIVFIFASNFLLMLELSYIKRMLNDTPNSLIRTCILLGVFSLCFNIIATIITTLLEYNVDSKDKNKLYFFSYKYYINAVDNNNISKEIILVVVFLVLNCIYNILQFLTIKYLSPNHVLITYIMFAIYSSIIIKFQNVEMEQLTFIFSIVLYIIFFFVLFIFLDIVQLNFCSISKEMTFKLGLKSDVDKYVQSFSSNDDNEENENIDENKNELNPTEMDEKKSVNSSDLESYNS